MKQITFRCRVDNDDTMTVRSEVANAELGINFCIQYATEMPDREVVLNKPQLRKLRDTIDTFLGPDAKEDTSSLWTEGR